MTPYFLYFPMVFIALPLDTRMYIARAMSVELDVDKEFVTALYVIAGLI